MTPLLQNYVFRGTSQGPTIYIHNKTILTQLDAIAVTRVSGSMIDLTIYSQENQPEVNSK